MRARGYRGDQSSRRKTIGAVAVAGVLLATGLTGVQLASAGTEAKAAEVINVDGQQFDVSQCGELAINAGAVVCDGEELAPIEEQDAGDAAAAAAQALEAACDQFVADIAAAGDERAGGDEQAGGEEQAGDDQQAGDGAAAGEQGKSAAQAKKERRALAKKWAKAMKAAGKGNANGKGKGNANGRGKGNGNGAGQEGGDAADAVADAQQGLLQACLTLADAKAAAAGDAGAGDDAGQGEAGQDEQAGQDEAGQDEQAGQEEQAATTRK